MFIFILLVLCLNAVSPFTFKPIPRLVLPQLRSSWSDSQSWALEDAALSPYVISTGEVLWRGLVKDTVELTGFTVDEVRSRWPNSPPPPILPLLTDYEVLPDDRLKGKISGLPGLTDGR